MYIAPNSTIKILRGVPLTSNYEHSIWFSKVEPRTQYEFFNSKTKFTFDNQMYQRQSKGTMRVRMTIGALYDCNYLMFQNNGFGNKWFYAFITNAEYVNNEVSEITYVLDVIQTWWYEWTFGSCFIERCHTTTDELYEHTIEEGLPCGDAYISPTLLADNQIQHIDMNDMGVVLLATEEPDGTKPTRQIINNVYVPLRVVFYHMSDSTEMNNLKQEINDYIDAGKEDSIVAIYQFPWMFRPGDNNEIRTYVKDVTYNVANVKNNKCNIYPYRFLRVTNNAGTTADFHYEDFVTTPDGSIPGVRHLEFDIAGTAVTMPAILCYPKNHRNIVSDYDFGITSGDLPEIGFVGDAFKAWWAQAKYAIMGNAGKASWQGAMTVMGQSMSNELQTTNFNRTVHRGKTLAPAQMSPATAGAMDAGTSFVNLAYDSLAEAQQKMIEPSDLHGQGLINSLNMGLGRMRYSFIPMTVKPDILAQIDDYFDRFGYRVNINATPNLIARPHWTFIKTAGCTFKDIKAPSDDMDMISAIFDKGITFWKNGNEVGSYELDNSPEANNNNG